MVESGASSRQPREQGAKTTQQVESKVRKTAGLRKLTSSPRAYSKAPQHSENIEFALIQWFTEEPVTPAALALAKAAWTSTPDHDTPPPDDRTSVAQCNRLLETLPEANAALQNLATANLA